MWPDSSHISVIRLTDRERHLRKMEENDISALDGGCEWEIAPDPCVIVIFGASGDLARRKLLPALYRLFLGCGLHEKFAVLGAARTVYSDDSFRERMRKAVDETDLPMSRWSEFASHLHYQPLFYDEGESYLRLSRRIESIEKAGSLGKCRIFNLAVPPSLYVPVIEGLGEAGLAAEDRERGFWTRLVVEKPFGRDLASSRKLSAAIGRFFDEEQVFRIDHYMAKETVQNILMFRFANTIFEPIWNRNYVDHVRINAGEALGIGDRAGYYEETGVLLDMHANHMMQLLSLVAAEPPSLFDADRVRDTQAELFRSLRPFPLDDVHDHLVIGQYGRGRSGGDDVAGYLDEQGVRESSPVPTYGLMKVFVDNWRWQGVPFYLTSGKRLRRKVTRIDIQFKNVPHSMLPPSLDHRLRANRLVLGIHPEEVIFLNFQAKKPGPKLKLRTVGLQFSYRSGREAAPLDAYAKAIIDTMSGDQTLFWRRDCLDLCWSYFDPLIQSMEACSYRLCNLHPYPAGSLGPRAAIDMLPPGSWPEKP